MITISTRASLKRYHTFTLTLGILPSAPPSPYTTTQQQQQQQQGYPATTTYHMQRIGTASEKQSVARELAELRERLAQVEAWERRRGEIERELGNVLVRPRAGERGGGGVLPAPRYVDQDATAEEAAVVDGPVGVEPAATS